MIRKVVIAILSVLALVAGTLWPNANFTPRVWSWSRNDSTWTEVCLHKGGLSILTIEDVGYPAFDAFVKSYSNYRGLVRQRYGFDNSLINFWPLPVGLDVAQCTRSSLLFVVLFAAYPTVAFIRGPFRRWRRRRNGLCVKCGYSLTGNESGVCPECGTIIAEPRSGDRAEARGVKRG